MMYAARAEHLARIINPARERGEIVVSDRFADSTTAYQGAAGGVAPALIEALYAHVVGDDGPDLTVILDLPAEAGLARADGRADDADEGRFERKGADFQTAVRKGFLSIAAAEPVRCRVIDANRPAEAVAADVWAAVEPLIEAWRGERGA